MGYEIKLGIINGNIKFKLLVFVVTNEFVISLP